MYITTNMLGPRLIMNSMNIAGFVTKKPMLRLLLRDVKRPLYHLVFLRRMLRMSWNAMFSDSHDTLELLEELLEDSTPAIIDAFVYAEFMVSVAVCLHFILHQKRKC